MTDYRDDDGRITYHYRRSDRLAGRDSDERGCVEGSGKRSRSRSLIIILIDVVLILIIYSMITTFVLPRAGRGAIGGVRVELQVQSLGKDDRYVVRFRPPRTAGGETAATPQLVDVVFYAGDTAISDRIVDLLPQRPGDELVVDIVRSRAEADTPIRVRIDVDDSELELEVKR